jgi:hypothetical protein
MSGVRLQTRDASKFKRKKVVVKRCTSKFWNLKAWGEAKGGFYEGGFNFFLDLRCKSC